MSLSVLSHSPVLKWRAPGLLRHKTTEPHVKGEKTHGSQAVQESQIFRTLAVHFVWETCVKTLKSRGGLLQQLAVIILILSSSMRLQSILRYCIKETLSLSLSVGSGGGGCRENEATHFVVRKVCSEKGLIKISFKLLHFLSQKVRYGQSSGYWWLRIPQLVLSHIRCFQTKESPVITHQTKWTKQLICFQKLSNSTVWGELFNRGRWERNHWLYWVNKSVFNKPFKKNFFFSHTHGIWRFPGQGSNLSRSCDMTYATAAATW